MTQKEIDVAEKVQVAKHAAASTVIDLKKILHPQSTQSPEQKAQVAEQKANATKENIRSVTETGPSIRNALNLEKDLQKIPSYIENTKPAIAKLSEVAERLAQQSKSDGISSNEKKFLEDTSAAIKAMLAKVSAGFKSTNEAIRNNDPRTAIANIKDAGIALAGAAASAKAADYISGLPAEQREKNLPSIMNYTSKLHSSVISNDNDAFQRTLNQQQKNEQTVQNMPALLRTDEQLRSVLGKTYDPQKQVEKALRTAAALSKNGDERAGKYINSATSAMNRVLEKSFRQTAQNEKKNAEAARNWVEQVKKQPGVVKPEYLEKLALGYQRLSLQYERAARLAGAGKLKDALSTYSEAAKSKFVLGVAQNNYIFSRNVDATFRSAMQFDNNLGHSKATQAMLREIAPIQRQAVALAAATNDAVQKAVPGGVLDPSVLKTNQESMASANGLATSLRKAQNDYLPVSQGISSSQHLIQDALKFRDISSQMKASGSDMNAVRALESNAQRLMAFAESAMLSPKAFADAYRTNGMFAGEFSLKDRVDDAYSRAWGSVGLIGYGNAGPNHPIWNQLAQADITRLGVVLSSKSPGTRTQDIIASRHAGQSWSDFKEFQAGAVKVALEGKLLSSDAQLKSLDALSKGASATSARYESALKGDFASAARYQNVSAKSELDFINAYYGMKKTNMKLDLGKELFHGLSAAFIPPVMVADLALDIATNYKHYSAGELAVKSAIGALSFVVAAGTIARLGSRAGEAMVLARAEQIAGTGMIPLGITDFAYTMGRQKEWNVDTIAGAINQTTTLATFVGMLALSRARVAPSRASRMQVREPRIAPVLEFETSPTLRLETPTVKNTGKIAFDITELSSKEMRSVREGQTEKGQTVSVKTSDILTGEKSRPLKAKSEESIPISSKDLESMKKSPEIGIEPKTAAAKPKAIRARAEAVAEQVPIPQEGGLRARLAAKVKAIKERNVERKAMKNEIEIDRAASDLSALDPSFTSKESRHIASELAGLRKADKNLARKYEEAIAGYLDETKRSFADSDFEVVIDLKDPNTQIQVIRKAREAVYADAGFELKKIDSYQLDDLQKKTGIAHLESILDFDSLFNTLIHDDLKRNLSAMSGIKNPSNIIIQRQFGATGAYKMTLVKGEKSVNVFIKEVSIKPDIFAGKLFEKTGIILPKMKSVIYSLPDGRTAEFGVMQDIARAKGVVKGVSFRELGVRDSNGELIHKDLVEAVQKDPAFMEKLGYNYELCRKRGLQDRHASNVYVVQKKDGSIGIAMIDLDLITSYPNLDDFIHTYSGQLNDVMDQLSFAFEGNKIFSDQLKSLLVDENFLIDAAAKLKKDARFIEMFASEFRRDPKIVFSQIDQIIRNVNDAPIRWQRIIKSKMIKIFLYDRMKKDGSFLRGVERANALDLKHLDTLLKQINKHDGEPVGWGRSKKEVAEKSRRQADGSLSTHSPLNGSHQSIIPSGPHAGRFRLDSKEAIYKLQEQFGLRTPSLEVSAGLDHLGFKNWAKISDQGFEVNVVRPVDFWSFTNDYALGSRGHGITY